MPESGRLSRLRTSDDGMTVIERSQNDDDALARLKRDLAWTLNERDTALSMAQDEAAENESLRQQLEGAVDLLREFTEHRFESTTSWADDWTQRVHEYVQSLTNPGRQ